MSTPVIALNEDDEREPGTVLLETGIALPIEADIAFDGFLVGSGWHPTEIFDGVCFRWMGGEETARVTAVIDRSLDLELCVYVPHIVDHACWDAVAFRIDGEPVAATLAVGDVRRFVMRVPTRADRASPHAAQEAAPFRSAQAERLALLEASGSLMEIEVCAPFAKQSNPDDARRLSIAVSLMRIRPIAPEALARNQIAVRGALLAYFQGRDLSALSPSAGALGDAP